MKRIAKFEKVSFEQFKKDVMKNIGTEIIPLDKIQEIYDSIELPTRATAGSAGYDFKIPFDMVCDKSNYYTIPTGIRARIEDGWVLKLYPRSGLGFKRNLKLANTVGIIDSDYYNSDNEGHIMIRINHSEGKYILSLEQGQGFAQGVFIEYGITEDDNVDVERNGGFGSTDKNV